MALKISGGNYRVGSAIGQAVWKLRLEIDKIKGGVQKSDALLVNGPAS